MSLNFFSDKKILIPVEETKKSLRENTLCYINPNLLYSNPNSSRFYDESGEEISRLSESISRDGLISPVTIRNAEGGRYEIISGHRRVAAAKDAGADKIPCIIVYATEADSAKMSLIENIMRKNLHFFEEAHAISRLIKKFGFTQEQTAKELCMSQSAVANKLRLLKFSKSEAELIKKYSFGERKARAFLNLKKDDRRDAIEYAEKHKLNTIQTESYVFSLISEEPEAEQLQTKKFVLKDLNFFFNSLNNAIKLVKSAGLDVKEDKDEDEEKIILKLTIRKTL